MIFNQRAADLDLPGGTFYFLRWYTPPSFTFRKALRAMAWSAGCWLFLWSRHAGAAHAVAVLDLSSGPAGLQILWRKLKPARCWPVIMLDWKVRRRASMVWRTLWHPDSCYRCTPYDSSEKHMSGFVVRFCLVGAAESDTAVWGIEITGLFTVLCLCCFCHQFRRKLWRLSTVWDSLMHKFSIKFAMIKNNKN